MRLVRTLVAAGIVILGEFSKFALAAGSLEDALLTRSKQNPRIPKARGRRRAVVPMMYTAVTFGWFGVMSDAHLINDPGGTFQTTPGNLWVLAAYIALMLLKLRRPSNRGSK